MSGESGRLEPLRCFLHTLPAVFLITVTGCGSNVPGSSLEESVETWRLAAAPLAVIGDEAPAGDVLSGAVSGLILSDSTIAVADGGSHEIRTYASDGALQGSFGGEGGGPGEFRNLSVIRHGIDGGICAWDKLSPRVTCFTRGGAVETTIEVDRSGLQQVFPVLLGMLPDTSIVLRDWPAIRQMHGNPEGEHRDSVSYLRYDAAGTPRGALVRAPGAETFFVDGEVWSDPSVIFGRGVADALDGGLLLVGINDSLDLRVCDAPGAVVRQIQRRAELAPVTDEMLAKVKARNARADSASQAQLAKSVPPEEVRKFARAHAEIARRLPHRETLPAFEDVHLDHAGRVWLGAPHPLDTDVREWKVLDEDFNPLAIVRLPARAEILDVGRDRILLLERDELGVKTVQLYAIGRAAP